ncbi:MAG: hypothetical protein IPP71_19795 [Bacteroidetes bacterium]|nr:hypothetical protein [Bacteroidota bacterium]
MDICEHALKRLNLVIGQEKAHREVRFMHQFILYGRYTIAWHYGMHLTDLAIFAERCDNFNIRVLGVELHIEGPYPIHVFAWEDYNIRNNSWVQNAIKDLEALNVPNFIVPTIEVHESVLNKYLK